MGAQDYGGFVVTWDTAAKWTKEEDAILCTVYPEKGVDACMQLLPGRSRDSVCSRVRILGVRLSPEALRAVRRAAAMKGTAAITRWDKQLDDRLRYVYTQHGLLAACAALPGFNKKAIKNRVFQLGLRRGHFGELAKIPDNWEELEPVKKLTPVGSWKAEVPPIRSVFDLAGVV